MVEEIFCRDSFRFVSLWSKWSRDVIRSGEGCYVLLVSFVRSWAFWIGIHVGSERWLGSRIAWRNTGSRSFWNEAYGVLNSILSPLFVMRGRSQPLSPQYYPTSVNLPTGSHSQFPPHLHSMCSLIATLMSMCSSIPTRMRHHSLATLPQLLRRKDEL
jgi:hypothetical protein